MNAEKIAIVADSATDVPPHLREGHDIFIVPVRINYADRSYLDGVDITTDEVCDRLAAEIPKTSLPSIGEIMEVYRNVIAAGFTKIIVITVSSGLSGTHNALRVAASDFHDAEFFFTDTLNIGFGAGITVLTAARLIRQGLCINEIVEKLKSAVKNTVIYFVVDTLEYLHKGGRIGSVLYTVGSALNLKPIISCNGEGTYFTAAKALGKRRALQKAVEMAEKFAKKFGEVNVAIASIRAEAQASHLYEKAKASIENAQEFILCGICPALTVHTGPGTVGICVQKAIAKRSDN